MGTIAPLLVVASLTFTAAGRIPLVERVVVPTEVVVGSDATLQCDYQLDEDRLLAVKWYHNDTQFFRFIPSESSTNGFMELESPTFMEGFTVDLAASSGRSVVLKGAGLAAEGRYTCEVMSDAPTFRTQHQSAYMRVVGCCEVIMASAIREAIKTVDGKESLAMEAFTSALDMIPTIIAGIAGLLLFNII